MYAGVGFFVLWGGWLVGWLAGGGGGGGGRPPPMCVLTLIEPFSVEIYPSQLIGRKGSQSGDGGSSCRFLVRGRG